MSPSDIAVTHVLLVRPRIKMVWIAAWRVVAMMQNVRPGRYWPISQFICHAMGGNDFATGLKATISIVIAWSREHPAPSIR